jgi:nucleoside-diphosphate-sugar epimerase
MNILVIGGTGLLGSHTVKEAIARGHSVSILSRGSASGGRGAAPKGLRLIQGDITVMTEAALREAMAGQEAVVYALGLDDRASLPKPAYEALHKDHVDTCLRVARAAKASGARKFVVFGSYFMSFERAHPEWRLAEIHPYVRTRKEQEEAVLGEASPGFDPFVLEIPYVIGAAPGQVPPWSFLFDMLSGRGKVAFFFGRGGTAAVTAGQVAQAALGAIERSGGGGAYPLGGINLSWKDLVRRFFAVRGEVKRILALPPFLFSIFGVLSALALSIAGKERGLDIGRFASLQYGEAFLDCEPAMKALGYGHADYDAELASMVREWEAIRP